MFGSPARSDQERLQLGGRDNDTEAARVPPKPNVTYTAPVGSVDLAAAGCEIWPCLECLPWYVEILRDPETDEVFAREWHAVDCPAFAELVDANDNKGF
jgi:hypothetical protein